MQAYRADRVPRMLTAIVSIAYVGIWVGAAVVLVGVPAVKLFAPDDPDWTWGLPVPATVADREATVVTRWGPARLRVEDVRGSVRLPIAMLPWWFVAVLWTHALVAFALMLPTLHHLRRIFQCVRDGAPFDTDNARRLRWVGLLLLALALLNGVAEFFTSMAVRRGLAGSSIMVPFAPRIDVPIVLVALMLVALAEIFRRGAELEDEQSLVV